jgi:hypothetical protein
MSRWLPAHVRRIIAILLLLLDLGLEPGSALSFAGISGSEDEAVADLCRKDDFSWGRSIPCLAISKAVGPARNAAYPSDGLVPVEQSASAEAARFYCAVILASAEGLLTAPDVPFEIIFYEFGLLPSDVDSPHRNSYVAQKQDIVLIV